MSETPRKRLPLRWLSLAELVGVGALVIAALGYWDAHREHSQEQSERAAAAQAEAKADALKQTFLMTGTVSDDGGKLRLTSVQSGQVIQTQTVYFPKVLRADSVETTGNPRLEAGWIEASIDKVVGHLKQGRVPVGVLTVYIEDGQTKTDRAIYELAYSLHPRLLREDKLNLEGLSLERRGVSGDLQAAVDRMWAPK
jgi:hypothetical protein